MGRYTLFAGMTLMLSVLFAAESCSSSPMLTKATGLAYEVVVVMDKAVWDGAAGESVKADLRSDVPGLPQIEPSLKITYVEPEHFDNFLRYVRNILVVKINPDVYTKVSVSVEKDKWARGQVVLAMNAPDQQAIVDFLTQHKNVLSNRYVKEEIQRAVDFLRSEYSPVVMSHVKSKFGYELNAPATITSYKDTTDFFWASNNAGTGRLDIVVYSFPYVDKETFTKEYLVAKRDSMMKQHMPGAFPNSYMQTEKKAEISYTPITLNGTYCGEMRGLWSMVGDMMGGPFVSHTVLDEKNQRVIVAEGFVYAPETDKRNFIRRVEAALFTLRPEGTEISGDVFGLSSNKE